MVDTHLNVEALMALPSETRREILKNVFQPELRIGERGEIYNTPSHLHPLLNPDMEQLQKTWVPSEDATLRITSPAQMKELPAVIKKLQEKASEAKKTWKGFREVQIAYYHEHALEHASKDILSYPFEISKTLLEDVARDQIAQVYNVERAWEEAKSNLTALNPEITRLLKVDIKLPEPVLAAVKRLEQPTVWWRSVINGVKRTLTPVDFDYELAYKERPHARMDSRAGKYPRIELTGLLPQEHIAEILTHSGRLVYAGNLEFA